MPAPYTHGRGAPLTPTDEQEYFLQLAFPQVACHFVVNLFNTGSRDLSDLELASLEGHVAACTTCQRRTRALHDVN